MKYKFRKGAKVRVISQFQQHKIGILSEPIYKGWSGRKIWTVRDKKGQKLGDFDEKELKIIPE